MAVKPANVFVHSTAEVSPDAEVGGGTRVWRNAHIREGARVGRGCNIGAGVYVGEGVLIGDNCKIQNQALLYEGLTLEDGVFVGPQVCFTNDYRPRAINPDGSLKSAEDWEMGQTRVKYGASVGAGAVVLTGLTIGRFAMVGARAVVTHDVPDHALVYGSPARIRGWVCACAWPLVVSAAEAVGRCPHCGITVALPIAVAELSLLRPA
jgi:acetyltransferase-like isoleucine patch superfamily enzyme